MIKPYNKKCLSCNDAYAYEGFITCECPNSKCQNYTQTQFDLVNQYQKYLKDLERELINTVPGHNDSQGFYNNSNCNNDAGSFNNLTDDDDKDITTIPYGVTGCYDPADPDDDAYNPTGYYNGNNSGNTDSTPPAQSNPDVQDLFGMI